jgi:uncharacterized damage-inducible protein DinB
MHAFFQDYLQRLADLHQDILDAIENLPPEAMDWTPLHETSSDMNSINVLVTHLCGAERFWIGDVASGDPSGRVRLQEFQVRGMNASVLADKIDTATKYAQAMLAKMSIDDLAEEGSSPGDDKTFTVGWALLHALEHTATHLGHIQITRQLWDENSVK